MRNGIRACLAMLAVAAAATGCASGVKPAAPGPVVARGVAAVEPAADPRPLGTADTAFGLDVLGAWCAQHPRQNLVFSPSTLASALGMAYLGARGATARAMARVLHLPAASADTLVAQLQARAAALGRLDGPGVTLSANDQVWADPTLPPRRGYLNAVATGYHAGVAQAPFSTDPKRAADAINSAISAATHGHITHLVTPDTLQDVGWVLTSALYMKARWATPLDPGETNPAPFTTTGGHKVTARFMTGYEVPYAAVNGWQAVSLPYRGGKLTMTALLPPSGSGGCALPSQATLRTVAADLSTAGNADTGTAFLPKVDLRTGGLLGDMKPVLLRLGMGLAFSSTAADFTALSKKACCVAFVQQAATLQVNEKGTVAAAAAAVGIYPASARTVVRPVRFDRPYLMLVTDTTTGEPLFLAKVGDPTAS